MDIRTDLVTEQSELHTDITEGTEEYEEWLGDVAIRHIKIKTDKASSLLAKPIGKYCTIEFGRLDRITDISNIVSAVTRALQQLTPKKRDNVLIAGLGNDDITPDALGPLTASSILATRHIGSILKKSIGLEDLRSVSVITPGVLGKTGIETVETISAAANCVKPDALIVIDALAARRPARLCRTIQLSNTGISPGSGVHNARKAINEKTVGVPVIAIGIPTVVDASTYRFDCDGAALDGDMMVTPKEIDLLIERSAQILSKAINIFLHPDIDSELIMSLV